jgi:methylenetetrahydrofolate reductase (NADPH)
VNKRFLKTQYKRQNRRISYMKIIDRLKEDKINISFEVFPPKTDAGFEKVLQATNKIAELDPAFISVTYGAGGGTSKNTAAIAKHIKENLNVESLAHLTCVSSTKDEVRNVIKNLKSMGIENILALRGDIPTEQVFPSEDRFRHAFELVNEIRKNGDFCIGAACYPEGHVENEHKEEDIRYLKEKVDQGVDFLTTQMFFDNDIHYNFLYRIREAGITVPVLPGIMPITSAKQMKRSCELSGTVFPRRFQAILDRFGDNEQAMRQAGIAYATDQIIDLLANGVKNIHIYSMNKPEVAEAIMYNLSDIVKC